MKMINMLNQKRSSGASVGLASIAATALLLGACASTPKAPTEAITAAELAIAAADQAHASEFAPVELTDARQKLVDARLDVQKEKMVQASRLAQEAQVSAELATAKTEAAKAKQVNDETRKSTQILKQELDRSTGNSTGTGGK